MAERRTTGVTPSGRGGRGRGGSFFKRNRTAILAGGGIGAFLLMSHKGSTSGSSSTGSPQDQLAAYQQGVQDAQGLIGQTTGASDGGFGGGGDSGSSDGGTGATTTDPGTGTGTALPTTADPGTDPGVTTGGDTQAAGGGPIQLGPININTGRATTARKPAGKGKGGTKAKGAATASKARGAARATRGSGGGAGHATTQHSSTTARRGAPSHKGGARGQKGIAPKQAAAGHPAPAASSGRHPATQHTTAKGKKKKSPAQVQGIFGFGAGIVIMGRQFPGAQSYRMGPPFTDSAGRLSRRCIVDYGGRTEQFVVHGDGSEWTDNLPGVNPPSRGVPMTMRRSDAA